MLLKQYHNILNMLSLRICDTELDHLCKLYRSIVLHNTKEHGRKFMVDYMRNLNSIAERYAMYQPIQPIRFRKSDRNGFPSELRLFKPYLRNEDPKVVKMSLSIFRSVELLRLPPSHNIETIERLPQYDEAVIKDIITYIPKFVQQNNIVVNFDDIYYHYSVKNGPNGPALATSDADLGALRLDTTLYEAAKLVSSKLGDTKFPKDEYVIESKVDSIHSKLTQFSEKSGKTRTIAVVDYYSQRALKPLHDALMKVLRKLPSDGTYSHNNVGNYVKEATSKKLDIVTSDMTAFTDLFPGILQRELLRELVKDQDLANAWWTLLAKRSFKLSWEDRYISYGTGQPMGAYASWPLCTLAHHLIVHYSAYKTNQKSVNKHYRIIGDDNAITNKIIASFYKETLSQLGCELNPYKGTSSICGAKRSSAEVAKRIYLNGKDLSPLTPGIVKSLMNPYLLNSTVRIISQSFDDNQTLPAALVQSVLSLLKSKNKIDKVLVLVTNPYDGVIKPGKPGYDDLLNHPWGPIMDQKELLYETMFQLRHNNLMSLSQKVMQDPKGFEGLWVRLQSEPQLPAHDLKGTAEDETVTQYAVLECAKHLRQRLYETLSKVMLQANQYDYDESESLLALHEVEYMPNPLNPFLDSKDVRNTHMSSLVISCYQELQAD